MTHRGLRCVLWKCLQHLDVRARRGITVGASLLEDSTQIGSIKVKGYENVFQQSDPNTFGSLSSDSTLRKRMKQMPEEKGDKEEVNFIDGMEGKRRLRTIEYAKMIKDLLDQKKVPEALNVLQTKMLSEDKAHPDRYIYSLLISGCADVGLTKKAFQLFNQLKKRGLKPNAGIYTSLFNACANSPRKEDGLERAHALRELMVDKGYVPNQLNYHAMIKAFGRCCDLESAFSVVDEMIQNGFTPSTETFNFLLQSCISNKESGFRHAIQVLKKLTEKKLIPDVHTYNLLLRCTKECSVGDHSAFLSEIVQLEPHPAHQEPPKGSLLSNAPGCEPSLPSSNSLSLSVPSVLGESSHLYSLDPSGKIELPEHRLMVLGGADGFLKSMLSNKVKPNLKTFTQLLEVIPSTLDDEKALISVMEKCNVKVDIVFCNMLIKKRTFSNRPKDAKDVLNLIKEKSLVMDVITFGTLSLACRGAQEINEFLTTMAACGYRCNIEILGSLVYTACRAWDLPLILQLLDRMTEEGLAPNGHIVKHLQRFEFEVNRVRESQSQKRSTHKKLLSQEFQEMFTSFLQRLRELEGNLPQTPSAYIHRRKQFSQVKT